MTLSTLRFVVGTGSTAFFGCKAIDKIAMATARLSAKRAFLVTDPGVAAAGISGEVQQRLTAAGVETTIFDQVHVNPTTEDLEVGARLIRGLVRDGAATSETAGYPSGAVVVAVGGGSVLDVAKGLALMAVNEGSACDVDSHARLAHPGLALIAVPTTAGTGSETNGFGVIENLDTGRKFYIGHESVVPRFSILDPQLTLGLPPGQTAAAGIDVLSHALESLSSRRCHPYAEALGLQAASMVSRFLMRAVADGQDLEARSQMLLAAHMAGLAFASTGLGLAHGVAHALSARLGVVHGAALATLLPPVLSFNLPVRTDAYARVAWALGVSDTRRDDQANAQSAIDAVRRLSLAVGMPGSLTELGCTEALLPALTEDALADEVIVNTPRFPDQPELQALLRAVL